MTPEAILVGCGEHARTVLVPVLQYCGVGLAAVCDTDAAAAETLARVTGARPYVDLTDALAAHRLSMGIVAAVPTSHSGLVRQLVEHGLAVLVEKPAGYSTTELSQSQTLTRARRATVQVGFMRRYAPAYRIARGLLRRTGTASIQLRAAAGTSGDPEFFLKDVGVHFFDLVRFLLGDIRDFEIETDRGRDGPHTWQALLRCTGGTATLLLSSAAGWGAPGEHLFAVSAGQTVEVANIIEVIQSDGGRVTMADDTTRRFPQATTRLWRPNFTSPRLMNHTLYLEGYVGEVEAFVRAATVGAPSTPDLADASVAMTLAEEFLSASRLRCAS